MAKRLGDMIAFRLTIVVTITGWVSSHSLSVVPSHIKPFIVGGSEGMLSNINKQYLNSLYYYLIMFTNVLFKLKLIRMNSRGK